VYFEKVKKTSVVQHVLDCLTESMIRKELCPGDRIPTEQELADQLGVARNSVREAVKILVFLGVLEIRRPEGTFVCDGFSEVMINPMIYGIILDGNNSYCSLMELREMMEAGVLSLAMYKCTADDLKELQKALGILKRACLSDRPNVEEVFAADNAFHDRIDRICGNLIVSKINSIVRVLSHKLRYDTVDKMLLSGQGKRLFDAHEQIFVLLKEKRQDNLNEILRSTYFLEELGFLPH